MDTIPILPPQEDEERVLVGQITRPQALKGWLRVKPEVDDWELLKPGLPVWTGLPGKIPVRFDVEAVRIQPKCLVMKLQGIDTIDDAERLRGQLLYVEKELLPPLEEDSFYYYELVGCQVELPDKTIVGEVEEVRPGAAGDLIVVKKEGKELLVPAVKDIVKSVDITNRLIVIDPPAGLL